MHMIHLLPTKRERQRAENKNIPKTLTVSTLALKSTIVFLTRTHTCRKRRGRRRGWDAIGGWFQGDVDGKQISPCA
jgi:hypothetical protein